MPLTMPYPDPTDITPLESTYIYCSVLNLDFASQTGRIVFQIHRSAATAYAGKQPLGEIAYNIYPYEIPPVYGERPVVTPEVPYQPAVLDELGNVVTPEVPYQPAVLGDPPIIKPAFPSFNQLMGENAQAFGAVAAAIYTLALSRPEFASASVLQE